MSKQEEIAGGMSYRTMKGIDEGIMSYLEGHDVKSSAEILEKNKEYYIASVNKIIARLELAQTRIENMDIPEKDKEMLHERLFYGTRWLTSLKKNIKKAKDSNEFQKAVSYKKWHAVKLIPSSAEGYAIAAFIEEHLMLSNSNRSKSSENKLSENHIKKLDNAKFNNQEAKSTFLELLNLNENSEFEAVEKRRIKAYEELNLAQNMLVWLNENFDMMN